MNYFGAQGASGERMEKHVLGKARHARYVNTSLLSRSPQYFLCAAQPSIEHPSDIHPVLHALHIPPFLPCRKEVKKWGEAAGLGSVRATSMVALRRACLAFSSCPSPSPTSFLFPTLHYLDKEFKIKVSSFADWFQIFSLIISHVLKNLAVFTRFPSFSITLVHFYTKSAFPSGHRNLCLIRLTESVYLTEWHLQIVFFPTPPGLTI